MNAETTRMKASVKSTADSPASSAARISRSRWREERGRPAAWRAGRRECAENDQYLSEQKFTTAPTISRLQ
jgi:hypothetical protein